MGWAVLRSDSPTVNTSDSPRFAHGGFTPVDAERPTARKKRLDSCTGLVTPRARIQLVFHGSDGLDCEWCKTTGESAEELSGIR